MPYELQDLVVDRVDLVDEGANSASFIELFKRKEKQEPMGYEDILELLKPEHAEVIKQAFAEKEADLSKAREDLEAANIANGNKETELAEANAELAKAKGEIEVLKSKHCECDGEEKDGICEVCGKPKKSASFDETETLKSMPEAARELFLKMRAQKEAAEEQVRKANEEKAEADAIAKAASLKAIPVEQEKLVGILKNCSTEIVELLTTINSAIEATVLDEVGKNRGNGAGTHAASSSDEAWNKLEQAANEIAKRDSVTKEKAMSKALDEYPELYREYLNGGNK